MKMNLQTFAEDAQADNAAKDPQASEAPESDQAKESEKTFTQDEVNQMIQKRLDRERKNHADDVKAAKDEAAKLAKMNADQKKDYELEQAKKQAEESANKLARYEMRDAARKMLNEAKLSLNDDELDLVVTDDAETTKANVDQLANIAKRIREDVRSEFLKGNTPRITGNNVVTKEEILKIPDQEQRLKAIREHLDLFDH